ncbi:hypothetical protein ACVIGB_000277 [Bradyrhizobium sp. USDA 4341]
MVDRLSIAAAAVSLFGGFGATRYRASDLVPLRPVARLTLGGMPASPHQIASPRARVGGTVAAHIKSGALPSK